MNKDVQILRDSIDAITQLLTNKGLRVTQKGVDAYVKADPVTGKPFLLNVPHIPDNASDQLIFAVQGFIDHEVGHVLDTDFSVLNDVAGKISSRLQNYWNIVEDTYIERMMRRRFPGSASNLGRLHSFFLESITTPAIEQAKSDDEFIGAIFVPLARAFAGQSVFEDFIENYLDDPRLAPILKAIDHLKPRFREVRSSAEALALAKDLESALHPPKKAPPPPPPPPASSEESKSEESSNSTEETDKNGDSAPAKGDASTDPSDGEGEDAGDDDKSSAGNDEGEDSSDEQDDAGDDEKDGDEQDETDDQEEDGGSDDGDADDDGDETSDENSNGAGSGEESDKTEPEDDAGSEDEGEASEGDQNGSAADDQPSEDDEGGEDGGSDDESSPSVVDFGDQLDDDDSPMGDMEMPEIKTFDGEILKNIAQGAVAEALSAPYNVYTSDHDYKGPVQVEKNFEGASITSIEDKTLHMVGKMQREIERMMAARSQVQKVGGLRSGRLNSSGLHRLVTNDDRVFYRKHENKSTDVAVILLVDNSGSMGEYGKIHSAIESAYAMSQTLEKVGVKHAVIGFTTFYTEFAQSLTQEAMKTHRETGVSFDRTEPLNMPFYKNFDERMSTEVKKRYAWVYEGNQMLAENIDGEAVKYAAGILAQRREKRKILMVFSDGRPAGRSVGAYSRNGLEQNLKNEVERAERAGIETIGIGIKDENVKRFYQKSSVLKNTFDLPALVMGEIKKILTAK